MLIHRYLAACIVLWIISGSAVAQVFKAELAVSEWKTVSAPTVCSMTHAIPGFGKAVLVHTRKKGNTFSIEPQNNMAFPVGEVSIETLPPVWRTDIGSLIIGKINVVNGRQPIKIEPAQTSLILEQLAQGVSVDFTAQLHIANNKSNQAVNGIDALHYVMEAKNFESSYDSFQKCSGEVSAIAPQKLDKNPELTKMLSYIKRDVDIYGVTIKGRRSNHNHEQLFAADIMSANWMSASNPFACSLTHNIPNFGKASFSHKSGGKETFYIEANDKIIFPEGDASIDTLPPVWRNTLMPINLGKVTAITGNKPITLTANIIAQVTSQLSSGVKVMFTSSEVTDEHNSNNALVDVGVMRVVIDPKNFVASYKNYEKCLDELINYTFSQVARTLINYPEKSEGLSSATKAELTKAIRYMKADSNIIGVLVDAHSDGLNDSAISDATSKQQADWVTAYLIDQGIAADKIISRAHGNKFPVASNTTEKGRSQNRRITVRLETEESRMEIKKKAAARKAALEAEKLNPSKGKLTPEDINKMIEGLDLIPEQ